MNSNRQAEPERMDILNYLKQSKHLWIIPAYGIFYMISFMLMEQSDVKIHMIHSLADDKIPFCPYFIIPYVLWYFFLIGTVIYFAVFCPSKKEYYLLCISERTASETGSWQYRRRCVYQCDTFFV